MPRVPVAVLIPLCIGGSLSGLMTWLNVGFVDGFLWRWLTGFISALPVMALGLVLMRWYDATLHRRLPVVSPTQRNLLLALLMAVTLETLLSGVVTLRNVGIGAGYFDAWGHAFLRSLPLGLAIGMLMVFIVKPWMQRSAARNQEGQR